MTRTESRERACGGAAPPEKGMLAQQARWQMRDPGCHGLSWAGHVQPLDRQLGASTLGFCFFAPDWAVCWVHGWGRICNLGARAGERKETRGEATDPAKDISQPGRRRPAAGDHAPHSSRCTPRGSLAGSAEARGRTRLVRCLDLFVCLPWPATHLTPRAPSSGSWAGQEEGMLARGVPP